MKWTAMQEKAVNYPVSDILVTAGAGSGKTQVLTGRIINRIQNGADISRLLIITFTRAAAAEMRSRISAKLTDAVRESPQNERLQKQLTLVGSADISTIDSFYSKLVRSYFYRLGIDPSFRIAEDMDTKLLKAEALADGLEYFYDADDSDFLSLVDTVCASKNDDKIRELVEAIWKFAESSPFPDEWLTNASNLYTSLSEEHAPFRDVLIQKAKTQLKIAIFHMENALAIADNTEGMERFVPDFQENIDYLRERLTVSDWDELRACTSYDLKALRGGKVQDEAAKALCGKEKSNAVKALKAIKTYLPMPYSDAIDDCLKMNVHVRTLIRVTKKVMGEYQQKKREKNLVDFNDLGHFTVCLLTDRNEDGDLIPSEIALEVQKRYDEIYVDEYQDCNDIQEIIFRMISSESSGNPNVFMVGDMKQSIYGFRQSNPKELFGEKADTYTPVTDSDGSDRHVKISLSENFRSRPELLSSINATFDRLMSKTVGDIDYVGGERLAAGSTVYTEPLPSSVSPMEVHHIICEEGHVDDLRRIQADYFTERIEELMASGMRVYDKNTDTFRPLCYGDCALLLRAPKISAHYYKEALLRCNIPHYVDDDSPLLSQTEIVVLLSLLKIIDNPLQDIPLICVLRSPLFSFSEDELAAFALQKKDYLYEAIEESVENKEDHKTVRFLKKLTEWREKSSFMNVPDFLSYLIADTGYYAFVSSTSNADEHLANVAYFLKLAKSSDASTQKGLFNFLKYIDRINEGPISPPNTDALPLDDLKAVHIMSIHKSKGLEFPVVFLCEADDKFQKNSKNTDIVFHKDLGIGLKAYTNKRTKHPLPTTLAIDSLNDDSGLSECMRLLYVALTRAREHVEVIGATSPPKADDYIPGDNASPILIAKKNSFLDWMLIAGKNNPEIKTLSVTGTLRQPEEAEDVSETVKPQPLSCRNDYREILEYRYPHTDRFHIKCKYTVSELKHELYESEEARPSYILQNADAMPNLKEPSFLISDRVFTSAQKGSIIHYVFQHLSFTSSVGFTEQLAGMNLTKEEMSVVDCRKFEAFLSSPLALRMRQAETVFRESPFTYLKKLSTITGKPTDDEDVLIQGIIDCWFIEDDGIVLVDYKTDRAASDEILKKRYAVQLDLYAEALSRSYGLPVKEKYIYAFDRGQVIKL